MNKKISFPIAIIIIVALAVLFGVVTVRLYLKTQKEDSEITACKTVTNLAERVLCYADLAAKREDVAICDSSSHEGVKYQCYAIFAEKTSNSEICERIPTTTEEHQALKDLCYSDIAEITHNEVLCENVVTPGLKDSCYYKVAKVTQDKEICNKINDPALKNGCFDLPFIESKMTQSQVLSIANDLARKEGYKLEEYLEPEIEYNSIERRWILFYEMKHPVKIGGCFGVNVNDDTGEAILIRCL